MSDIGHRTLDDGHRTLDVRHQMSDVGRQTTDIGFVQTKTDDPPKKVTFSPISAEFQGENVTFGRHLGENVTIFGRIISVKVKVKVKFLTQNQLQYHFWKWSVLMVLIVPSYFEKCFWKGSKNLFLKW